MISRIALVSALLFGLAACGAEKKETTEATSEQAPAAEATPAAGASETPAPDASETPDAAPDDAASATPTPTLTPTASASKAAPTPAATPAKVAAVAPDAFKQCAVCHSTEKGKNLIGPSLAGVFGTKAGDIPGFNFSPAMKASGMVWNAANLDKYLADPKGTIPGNTMSFGGVKDAAKRQAIIEYLKTI